MWDAWGSWWGRANHREGSVQTLTRKAQNLPADIWEASSYPRSIDETPDDRRSTNADLDKVGTHENVSPKTLDSPKFPTNWARGSFQIKTVHR